MLSAVQSSPPPSVTSSSIESSGGGASPEARLLALMVYSQLSQVEGAETSVTLNQNQLTELRRQVREALEEAREANEDSGFWGDIGDVLGGDLASLAGVVAMAAATVASGGTAAVVLGAIAIGCSLASKYGDELGLPPKLSMCIGLVAVAASIAAGNVGAAAQASTAANAGAGAAQAGAGAAQVSGVATQVGAGAAQASRLTQVAGEIARGAKVVQSGLAAGGALANGVSGYYASEALEDQANATAAENKGELTTLDIDEAIQLLGEAIDRQASLCEAGNQIVTAKQHANQLIIQNFSGVA